MGQSSPTQLLLLQLCRTVIPIAPLSPTLGPVCRAGTRGGGMEQVVEDPAPLFPGNKDLHLLQG